MDSITSSMTREEIAALLGSGRLYSPGRDSLYTVDELMAGYESDAPMQSLDARLAAHVKACGIPPEDVNEAIAQVVHDQGVEQAMRAYVAASVAKGRHIVGVMGGSSTPRDAPAYRLAAADGEGGQRGRVPRGYRRRPGNHGGGEPGRLLRRTSGRGAARRDRGAETLRRSTVGTKPSTSTPHA